MEQPSKASAQTAMTETEKSFRTKLAACYRIFAHLGWDELIYNHISVKLPGDQEHFLINPFGLHYSEVTASSLVKVDVDGNVVEATEHQVNPAGITIHTAIHSARPDIVAISHLHTTAGMAVACSKEGLRHDNFYSVALAGQVAYHPFEGITVDPGEKERLIKNLGDKSLLILRSHGTLAGGATIEAMFHNTWALQRSCEVQMECDKSRCEIEPMSKQIIEGIEAQVAIQQGNNKKGVLEFQALQRLITAEDSSYMDL